MTIKKTDELSLLFKIAKIVEIAKYLLPLLSIVIIYGIYSKYGIDNIIGIIAIIVAILSAFSFYLLNAFITIEKETYKPKQYLILAFSFLLFIVIVLFFSCIFFDYPKNFKQLFTTKPIELGEPTTNILSFQIDGGFYDDCHYPFIYPDTILNAKNKDTLVITQKYSQTEYENFPKAPAFIASSYNSGYVGFYLPLHITSNNVKKNVTIGQTFRVRIKSFNDKIDSLNAGQTCAGDADFHEPNKIIILSTEKSAYTTEVTFTKADFYTSKPDEQNSFEFYFKIKDPGRYNIEIDVPYTFNGKRAFETFKVMPFIAPKSYYLWEGLVSNNEFGRSKMMYLQWTGLKYKKTGISEAYRSL